MTLADLVRLLRDTVLTAHLGVYHHATDATRDLPAITVGAGSPQGYRVTGMEAVVQATPEDSPRPLLGDGHEVRRSWVVVLKAWDDGLSLRDAVQAIIRRWPQTPDPSYIPATDDSIPQATIRIPEFVHWEAASETGGVNA